MRVRLTTPVRLRLFLGGTAVALVGLVVALGVAVATVHDGLRVVGQDAGPRVVAANELYGALAGMDAELANVLLVGDEPGPGFDRKAALDAYSANRDAVAKALQQAAEGTHSAVAREAVDDLVAEVAAYANLAGQIMLTDRQADARSVSNVSPALPQLREATDLLHQRLLPAADRLVGEDAAAIEQAFTSSHGTGRGAAYAALILGVTAVGVLIGVQVFVFVRTHRILNPGMLVATILTAVLTVQAVGAVFAAAEQLRVAKRDAFDSVLAITARRQSRPTRTATRAATWSTPAARPATRTRSWRSRSSWPTSLAPTSGPTTTNSPPPRNASRHTRWAPNRPSQATCSAASRRRRHRRRTRARSLHAWTVRQPAARSRPVTHVIPGAVPGSPSTPPIAKSRPAPQPRDDTSAMRRFFTRGRWWRRVPKSGGFLEDGYIAQQSPYACPVEYADDHDLETWWWQL